MGKNFDIITSAVALIIKAVIMAGRFSGTVRRRSLKRLAARDVDTKDKEMLFLKDKVCQLEIQVSILQKRIKKQQKKPRYTIRECKMDHRVSLEGRCVVFMLCHPLPPLSTRRRSLDRSMIHESSPDVGLIDQH